MLQIFFRNSVAASFNNLILMSELEQSCFGIDGTRDVLVDQRRVDQEAFAEEANRTLLISKADERDAPISPRQTFSMEHKLLGQQWVRNADMNAPGRLLSKFGIAMLGVVESFESRQFFSEMLKTLKPLASKKELLIDVVEAFHNPVTPRLCFRDEDWFHTQVEAQANEQTEAAGIAVGASEGKLVVHLEHLGYTQPLPSRHDSLNDISRPLAGCCLQCHSVTEGIDKMDSVEPLTALEVSRTHQVQLVDAVGSLGKYRGIGCFTGHVSGLDHQPVPLEDSVDRPDIRQRFDSHLLELPLDGECSFLGVPGGREPSSDFTNQTFHFLCDFSGNLLGSPGAVLWPSWIFGTVAFEPIVEPPARAAQSPTDDADLFTLEISSDRFDASFLLLHRPPPFWRWSITDRGDVTNVMLQTQH